MPFASAQADLRYFGWPQTPLTFVATRTFTRWPANADPPVNCQVTYLADGRVLRRLVLKPLAGLRPSALLDEIASVVLVTTKHVERRAGRRASTRGCWLRVRRVVARRGHVDRAAGEVCVAVDRDLARAARTGERAAGRVRGDRQVDDGRAVGRDHLVQRIQDLDHGLLGPDGAGCTATRLRHEGERLIGRADVEGAAGRGGPGRAAGGVSV